MTIEESPEPQPEVSQDVTAGPPPEMQDAADAQIAELPPPPPPEPLRPVAASERVETIDALRGLALFGILAANIRGFAGPAVTYFSHPHLFWPAFHDRLVQAFVDTFIQGKFITIFAFLFGVGFAVQFERATARSGKFGWTYFRRLGVLMLFGLIHGLLIWFGDILLMYALSGLMLLAFRKRQNKTVVVWATIFLLLMPLLMTGAFLAAQAGVKMPSPKLPTAEQLARLDRTFSDGSWGAIAAQRSKDVIQFNWGIAPVFGWHIIGLFLLGVLAWRKRFFHPTPESLPRYRRMMFWGLFVGVTGSVTASLIKWFGDLPPAPVVPAAYAKEMIGHFATPSLSLGYICIVILLMQSEAWRHRLRRFTAIGRTALSNYLLQSVIGTLIFYSYGLGFFGDIGPALLLPLTIVIFAAQAYVSPWWIERYRFGPVEWLWRRLTYGGPLPMRREPVSVTDAASMPQAALRAAPPE